MIRKMLLIKNYIYEYINKKNLRFIYCILFYSYKRLGKILVSFFFN